MPGKAGAVQGSPPQPERLASETQTAAYIADLLGQLERLAQSAGLVRLQYLLRESVEEAERLSAGP